MAYDIKITLRKAGIQAVFVIVAGLAAVYGENPLYLAIAPALEGLVNWIKHMND